MSKAIRMALGARRTQVLRMVLREAALLVLTGTAAGALLSLAAGQSARSLIFGLTAWDPRALAGAIMLLALVGLGAALLPARAAGIDPATALRYE
jgi:ABC-type antimicrobial peptide transport system permease subunit